MKNKIFDINLFVESLRRTSVMGWVFTVLLSVQAAFLAIGRYIDTYPPTVKEGLGFFEINPLLIILPITAAPVFMRVLFGFLNKRSTSDFWHSVPFTRQCIAVTFFAAAFTRCAMAGVISTAVAVIGNLFSYKYFVIEFSSVILTLLCILIMCLLVMSAILVAMSVTGTALNNFVVAAIILFLPRIIIGFFESATSHGFLFDNTISTGFASGSLNLLFGTFGGVLFSVSSYSEMFSSAASMFYTLGLAAVYFAIGMLLFIKRKSETAGLSSVNRYIQTASRVLVAFVICFIPVYAITNALNKGFSMSGNAFFFIVMYTVALLAYFIYELATTKSVKSMVKSASTLWILAVLNVVVIFGAHLTYEAKLGYTPDPESVTAVRVMGDSRPYNADNYFDNRISDVAIQDDELEKYLCDLYVQSREKCEKSPVNFENSITVGFKDGLSYKYRNLLVSKQQYAKILNMLEKSEQIKQIYEVDDIIDSAVSYDVVVDLTGYEEITKKDVEEIIATYKQDVADMGFEKWREKLEKSGDYYYTDKSGKQRYVLRAGWISCIMPDGGFVNMDIGIDTPKTYGLLMQKAMDYQKKSGLQTKAINTLKKSNDRQTTISFSIYDGKERVWIMGEEDSYKADADLLAEELEKTLGEAPTSNDVLVTVHISRLISNEEETRWAEEKVYFKLSRHCKYFIKK